jgi:hypothetical protein
MRETTTLTPQVGHSGFGSVTCAFSFEEHRLAYRTADNPPSPGPTLTAKPLRAFQPSCELFNEIEIPIKHRARFQRSIYIADEPPKCG